MDAPTATAAPEKASTASAYELSQAIGRNHFVGWYKLGDTVIPVFKLDGTYYSVCRGFEVPLKESPEGLEWALTPSSMEGTTIGFDETSNRYYIKVKDSRAQYEEHAWPPERDFLTRIDKPSCILDATTSPPRANDDFLGWYQYVWFPIVRFEIRKDEESYRSTVHYLDEQGVWKIEDEPHELMALPDRLGFTVDRKGEASLTYNEALKRFELTNEDGKRQPAVIRMPIARVPAPSSPEEGEAPEPMRIGIPSWH
jgi:hypothetical protein